MGGLGCGPVAQLLPVCFSSEQTNSVSKISLSLILLLGLFAVSPLEAGQEPVNPISLSHYPYQKGTLELQTGAGAFFSFGDREEINYASEYLRAGWMLSNVHGHGLLRGNWQGLIEVFGGEVFVGPGTGFVGGSLIGRYNFVQEQARLVPYFQLGGGGMYDDIYRNRSQHIIGSGFEFLLRTGFGLRWHLTPKCALFAETEYQHISNANTASRNVGNNAFGATVGFSWFF